MDVCLDVVGFGVWLNVVGFCVVCFDVSVRLGVVVCGICLGVVGHGACVCVSNRVGIAGRGDDLGVGRDGCLSAHQKSKCFGSVLMLTVCFPAPRSAMSP